MGAGGLTGLAQLGACSDLVSLAGMASGHPPGGFFGTPNDFGRWANVLLAPAVAETAEGENDYHDDRLP
jgi:hypothetical protein